MTNILREFNFSSEYLYKLLAVVMAFDIASLSTAIDRQAVSSFFSKHSKSILLIDYIPFVGPLYNATYALNLLFSFWPTKAKAETFQEEEREEEDEEDDGGGGGGGGDAPRNGSTSTSASELEKSRLIRVKGLTAVATALIDLSTLCLTVGVLAYVFDCLARINTFSLVGYLLVLAILAAVLALTVGAKIISGQLVENVTRQLEDVSTVGTSMVKSVTITATAIEKIVETTNTTTNAFVATLTAWWTDLVDRVLAVVYFPRDCYRSVAGGVEQRLAAGRRQVGKVRLQCRRAVRTIRTYADLRLLPVRGLAAAAVRAKQQ